MGTLAQENRQQLTAQATGGQVLAFVRELQSKPKGEQDPGILCGGSDALLMPFTNWTRASLVRYNQFRPSSYRVGR